MRKVVLLIAILSLVALACGCLSISMYTKVQGNGNVSDMKIVINTTSTVYGFLQQSAQKEGYSTVKEYVLANFTKVYGNSSGNTFDYNEEWSGENVMMTLTAKGSFNLSNDSPMKIYREGDYMVFKYASAAKSTPTPTPASRPSASGYVPFDNSSSISSLGGLGDAILGGVTFNFYLEMPGKIVESNANVYEKNKAEWHLTGMTMQNTTMYAKSEMPVTVPGFGGLLAVSGIFATGYWLAVRKKED